jgi:hypothetical protein
VAADGRLTTVRRTKFGKQGYLESLWLESERQRISADPATGLFLFPIYQLADSFMGAALELNESLSCEHNDFEEPDIEIWLPSDSTSRAA